MSFANLKRNRTTVDKLVAEAEKSGSGKKDYSDDRMWKPTVDKAGNAYAVIRFLPEAPENDLPWNKYWDHGFQGPAGQWYIEKSLTSLNQDDPVSEYNSELWSVSKDDDSPTRKQARNQKRRLHYVSNIYVVSDPSKPENEGKVFIFQYGKKIFDKIQDALKPQFPTEVPCNVFDMWEGANFELKQRKVEGWPNFDKSQFMKPEALFEDDKKLEAVYNQMYDLRWFTDPANYKAYDELKKKFNKVMGLDAPAKDETKTPLRSEEARSPGKTQESRAVREPVDEEPSDDDDNASQLSYFERLAQEED